MARYYRRTASSMLPDTLIVLCRTAARTYLGGDNGVGDDAAPHQRPSDDVRAEVVLRASGELLAG